MTEPDKESSTEIRVRCLFDYKKNTPKELDFKKDDTLKVIQQHKSGWWRGERFDGQTGLFPSNFVKVIEYECTVVALFDYTGKANLSQLSFKKGDVLRVLSRDKSGWWKGDLRGRVGLFPKNFVKEQESSSEAATTAPPSNTNTAASTTAPTTTTTTG
eukprot:CAMPEP_0168580978 /NCGR_PEP_ID=MMETSP0420-20121227/1123_1 /TAXON_ID=498008 /ORGANISM="Pessonella sp." /LENGTH=157 /DNA_ID=CAMNT_0008615207 /DNA_START=32 /DNA_END=502 /DNA_ORIENTATION=-